MHSLGIIAEYNPFHSGHAYQLAEAKKLHGGSVVVVLSGDFVQRGEAAIFDKFTRASHALANGADLVLQLPTVFSLSSAQRFANAGIRILASCGIVSTVCFGSECGDLQQLRSIQRQLHAEDSALKSAIRGHIKQGLSYPASTARAIGTAFPLKANDLLALEYLRAMENTSLDALCVKREGAYHDEMNMGISFTSASAIREALHAGKPENAAPYLPPNLTKSIISKKIRKMDALSPVILYALRAMELDELRTLPDVKEGLENVIYKQCRACTDYESFLLACKSKRYTFARLRRIAMCALIKIQESDLSCTPYIRVLGVKSEARPLLSELACKSSLPVVTRFADVAQLPPDCRRLYELDMRAAQIACLCDHSPAVFDFSAPLLIV